MPDWTARPAGCPRWRRSSPSCPRRECGPAGAPVVVFLHGVPDSWWQWHYALDAFGTEYRCLAVDLKGYGQGKRRAPLRLRSLLALRSARGNDRRAPGIPRTGSSRDRARGGVEGRRPLLTGAGAVAWTRHARIR
ncbi:alpha/beta fold hydrolase [Streptomyces sp. NPDC058464]|uniref:alpha/beta fold hydrolase n=1 Tax=Streptomyces sp. NPDC058464 TaxID=3346511 RepID=UPI00364A1C34